MDSHFWWILVLGPCDVKVSWNPSLGLCDYLNSPIFGSLWCNQHSFSEPTRGLHTSHLSIACDIRYYYFMVTFSGRDYSYSSFVFDLINDLKPQNLLFITYPIFYRSIYPWPKDPQSWSWEINLIKNLWSSFGHKIEDDIVLVFTNSP